MLLLLLLLPRLTLRGLLHEDGRDSPRYRGFARRR